jgi:hypothetical protein
MTKDSDPVTATLSRAEWEMIYSLLRGWGATRPVADRLVAADRVQAALNPPAAPDPATFEVKVPDPERKGPWPELKSSQDATRDRG